MTDRIEVPKAGVYVREEKAKEPEGMMGGIPMVNRTAPVEAADSPSKETSPEPTATTSEPVIVEPEPAEIELAPVPVVVKADWRRDQRRLLSYYPKFPFGSRSKRVRSELCPELQFVTALIGDYMNTSLFQGFRNEADQNLAYASKTSKLKWPHSKHNKTPSDAVDMAPYPINWDDVEGIRYFAGLVVGMAIPYGIELRNGGDWDQDGDVHDQELIDLVHFEVVR